MSNWDGLNRRKFPRVEYPCLVMINKGEGEPHDVFLTHTENVGIGGICVIMRNNLRMFCPVEIELDLLDWGNHLRCKGKVVWNVQRRNTVDHKPLFYDIGIEFDDLDAKERKRLEEIVGRLSKGQKQSL